MKNSLSERLKELRASDYYPFHMPGHKRQRMPELPVTELDITEIDGFDNLYTADGILKECMDLAAEVFGSRRTYFGVNGSTGNLLTAISAAFAPGEAVLVARNCHKAVYHAIELRGLRPVYIYPVIKEDYDICLGIGADEVKAAWEAYMNSPGGEKYPLAGMILTSPTYEGFLSEVKEIAEFLHQKEGFLIVDEAHGAHLGFHPAFPQGAVHSGADLVIQSIHKTLPAMTQTSLLHLCSERISAKKVEKYFGMYQTSSPSYVMMMSIDTCVRLLKENAEELFEAYAKRLTRFYDDVKSLRVLKVIPEEKKDNGKIVICLPSDIQAQEVYHKLRETYHLQPEMCGLHHVLMMTSVYDTDDGFNRLQEALSEMDAEYTMNRTGRKEAERISLWKNRPEQSMLPCEAVAKKCRLSAFKTCAGFVSAEYMYLYPPGIPFLVPGERIPDNLPEVLLQLRERGYRTEGFCEPDGIYTVAGTEQPGCM